MRAAIIGNQLTLFAKGITAMHCAQSAPKSNMCFTKKLKHTRNLIMRMTPPVETVENVASDDEYEAESGTDPVQYHTDPSSAIENDKREFIALQDRITILAKEITALKKEQKPMKQRILQYMRDSHLDVLFLDDIKFEIGTKDVFKVTPSQLAESHPELVQIYTNPKEYAKCNRVKR